MTVFFSFLRRQMSAAQKRWNFDADSIAFCQRSLPEDVISRKRMGIRNAERRAEKRVSLRHVLKRHLSVV
jgi:hypothetical protein